MKQATLYVFMLGRTPELSLWEIQAVFRKNGIPYKLMQYSRQTALIESKDDLDTVLLNKTLGGTIKIGKIVYALALPVTIEKVEQVLTSQELLSVLFPQTASRVSFGISVYLCGSKEGAEQPFLKARHSLLLNIKDTLEERLIKNRFPHHEGAFLSSASVEKNGLLKNGAEILFIVTQNKLLIGKTLAVQEFEAFSTRDYGRPVRDMQAGVMPPKLARMMINIAQIKKDGVLLDPFCGSGTVLQEAALLGYKNIRGTDASEKAVSDSKTNIAWLQKNNLVSQAMFTIERQDVKELAVRLPEKSIDSIVTEPYLGPNHKRMPQAKDIMNMQKELHELYLLAFTNFQKILKPSGTVIMILPVFNTNGKYTFLPILEEITKTGFTKIPLSEQSRGTILVGNKHDFVLREIVKYTKI